MPAVITETPHGLICIYKCICLLMQRLLRTLSQLWLSEASILARMSTMRRKALRRFAVIYNVDLLLAALRYAKVHFYPPKIAC